MSDSPPIEVGMTVTLPPVHAVMLAEGPDDLPADGGVEFTVTEDNVDEIRELVGGGGQ